MATATVRRLARRHNRLTSLVASRAVREAARVRRQGTVAVASVVATHQVTAAKLSADVVPEMLLEQNIDAAADAILELLSFTTAAPDLDRMLAQVDTDFEFDRLVQSIVTDAARAAEEVAVAVRQDVWHVRFVNPPCCSRCAILAGRVYRWSDGFQRHPGCDCSMIPTTVASPLVQDPDELVRQGLVTGLSKADRLALEDGADLGRVVNVRSKKAGLLESGHALTRGGRPTPAGIYRQAGDDRAKAVELLRRFGYIR